VYLELSQLSVANHYNSVLIEVADLYK